MTNSEREADTHSAEVIAACDAYDKAAPVDCEPASNIGMQAAIAALDAHRAGQVCVWEKDYMELRTGCTQDIHEQKHGDFCPDCGKRVEVK